jgi:hypothetical protein
VYAVRAGCPEQSTSSEGLLVFLGAAANQSLASRLQFCGVGPELGNGCTRKDVSQLFDRGDARKKGTDPLDIRNAGEPRAWRAGTSDGLQLPTEPLHRRSIQELN